MSTLGSYSVIGHHRVSCALVALTTVMATAPLVADSTQSQLTVSVTVVRSCVVDAQPVAGDAPRLRLQCATGAARDVQVTTSNAAPVSSGAPHADLRVVTVNF